MQVKPQCLPCYLTQCINAMEKGGIPEEQQIPLLNSIIPNLNKLPEKTSPAETSSLVLHKLQEKLQGRDLFREAKTESNRKALELLPELERLMGEAQDPLWFALQVSVAGNVVDLGILEGYDLQQSLQEVFRKEFAANDYPVFRQYVEKTEKVLIIGDNSGEIAFDRLLVQYLQSLGKVVLYSVKGGPVLNDATIEDAREVQMNELCKVITTGNNYLGVIEHGLAQEFREALTEADLVISKGQANYETLNQSALAGNNTFFLLKAKCALVGEDIGVKLGDLVLKCVQ